MNKSTNSKERAILLLSNELGREREASSIKVEDGARSFEITNLIVADHANIAPINNLIYTINSNQNEHTRAATSLLISDDIFVNPVYKSYKMIVSMIKDLAEISLDFIRLRSKGKDQQTYEIIKGKDAIDLLNGTLKDNKTIEFDRN